MHRTLYDQIRGNSVALISRVVAVSSLGYNTWRNERTEQNRNIRSAGLELLMKPGELRELVFLAHYDRDTERGNPRGGWAYVLTVRDPGKNMPTPVAASAGTRFVTWQQNWEGLGTESGDIDRVTDAIDELRGRVNAALIEID